MPNTRVLCKPFEYDFRYTSDGQEGPDCFRAKCLHQMENLMFTKNPILKCSDYYQPYLGWTNCLPFFMNFAFAYKTGND